MMLFSSYVLEKTLIDQHLSLMALFRSCVLDNVTYEPHLVILLCLYFFSFTYLFPIPVSYSDVQFTGLE